MTELENGQSKDDAQRRRDEMRQQAWAEIGLNAPVFEDDRTAPPVDRAALRRLVCRELEESEQFKLYDLILRFRSWADEFVAALLKEDGPQAKDIATSKKPRRKST